VGSLEQYSLEWIRHRGAIAATKRSESQTETTLDLIVRDALSSIEFSQTRVYLGEKYKALDSIIKCRVGRKVL
jgi:hypothetical protein